MSKIIKRPYNHIALAYDTLHYSSMSTHVATLNGTDIYYDHGMFYCDPLPSLIVLQSIVSYLFSEGFIEDEDVF